MISVVVCAGVRIYREGLADALERSGAIRVLAAVPDVVDALLLADELGPDLVLCDVSSLPAEELPRRLRELAAAASLVALGVPEQEEHVLACAECGLAGFVTRELSLADLVEALEAAARGELLCSPQAAATLLRRVRSLAAAQRPSPTAALTGREVQILDLLTTGLSNKEIATRLRIEPTTVKNHVHSILGKLNVRRRSDAAVIRSLAP